MDSSWTEPEIVRGLQTGNPDAWAALCDRHSERLWTYVARLIGSNEAVVADVFQDTLLAVARSGRSLNDDSRLWPWLAAIGHNHCALHWRKQNQRATEQLVENHIDVGPDDVLVRRETAETVRILLAEMPSKYAAILTAKYIDGHSAAEIAELQGDTLESVRSRLARARRDFRARYEAVSKELTATETE